MKTAVVVSADGEWKAVRDMLPSAVAGRDGPWDAFSTELERHSLQFVHGGWGKISAAASAQYVIDHFRPDLLVNIGTCGGLKGRIEQGTIVLVERTLVYDILEQMTDAQAAMQHYSTVLDLTWLPSHLPVPVQRGFLVSADRDIVPAEADMLSAEHGAVAADWESGAIAWVANRNRQRLLILRGVTDLVSQEGGEVYGNYGLFLERTKEIMQRLVRSLPKWLDAIGPAS